MLRWHYRKHKNRASDVYELHDGAMVFGTVSMWDHAWIGYARRREGNWGEMGMVGPSGGFKYAKAAREAVYLHVRRWQELDAVRRLGAG